MSARLGIVMTLVSPALLAIRVGGVSLGDAVIVVASGLLIVSLASHGASKIPVWLLCLPALLVIGVLSTLMASLDANAVSWFEVMPASTWLLRLAVLTLLILPFAAVLPVHGEFAVRSLISVATVVSLIAVLGWTLEVFGVAPGWIDLVDYRAGFTVPRAEGSFSEPARLGAYLALTLPWLVAARRQRPLPLVIVSAAILLTLSPTAMALAGTVFLALVLTSLVDNRWRTQRPFLLSVLALTVLGFALLPDSFQAKELTVGRIEAFVAGQERSGNIRVYGSWEPAIVALSTRTLLGSSPGNMGRLALAEKPELGLRGFSEEAHSWNVLALIAGSLGILGALALVCGFARLSWTAPLAGVLVVAYSVASSDVLHPTLWIFGLLLQSHGTAVAASPHGELENSSTDLGARANIEDVRTQA